MYFEIFSSVLARSPLAPSGVSLLIENFRTAEAGLSCVSFMAARI